MTRVAVTVALVLLAAFGAGCGADTRPVGAPADMDYGGTEFETGIDSPNIDAAHDVSEWGDFADSPSDVYDRADDEAASEGEAFDSGDALDADLSGDAEQTDSVEGEGTRDERRLRVVPTGGDVPPWVFGPYDARVFNLGTLTHPGVVAVGGMITFAGAAAEARVTFVDFDAGRTGFEPPAVSVLSDIAGRVAARVAPGVYWVWIGPAQRRSGYTPPPFVLTEPLRATAGLDPAVVVELDRPWPRAGFVLVGDADGRFIGLSVEARDRNRGLRSAASLISAERRFDVALPEASGVYDLEIGARPVTIDGRPPMPSIVLDSLIVVDATGVAVPSLVAGTGGSYELHVDRTGPPARGVCRASGTVRDADGAPVAGVQVRFDAQVSASPPVRAFRGTAVTGNDGAYVVRLPPALYDIAFTPPSDALAAAGRFGPFVCLGGESDAGVDPETGLPLWQRTADAQLGRRSQAAFAALRPDGRPLADGLFVLTRLAQDGTPFATQNVRTGATGEAVTALDAGDYGGRLEPPDGSGLAPTPFSFSVGETGVMVRVQALPGRAVTAVLLNPDGTRMAGAQVDLIRDDGNRRLEAAGFTDAAGEVRLIVPER